jgi:hypothetical protein
VLLDLLAYLAALSVDAVQKKQAEPEGVIALRISFAYGFKR